MLVLLLYMQRAEHPKSHNLAMPYINAGVHMTGECFRVLCPGEQSLSRGDKLEP